MAQILFRPTCSNCGKQLYEIISYEKQSALFCAALFERGIEPEICPYCKEVFDSIEIPCSLPFDNSPDKI